MCWYCRGQKETEPVSALKKYKTGKYKIETAASLLAAVSILYFESDFTPRSCRRSRRYAKR